MKIKTKYQGEVEITKEQIINFPKGILGFEEHKEFVILSIKGNDSFMFLQDIHNEHISFLITNPWDFFENYDIVVKDDKLEEIDINPKEIDGIEVYSIVNLGSSFQESTTNLLAPIIINTEDKKGQQFILNESHYTTKHGLFPEGVNHASAK